MTPTAPVEPPPIVVSGAPEVTVVPLLGGTLLATRDGRHAVAAAPELGTLSIVDIAAAQLVTQLDLGLQSVPTRMVEDALGTVHVVLRGSGAVVSIDPDAPDARLTRPVCPDPRGIAYDPVASELVVACQSGRLVWFSGEQLAPVRSAFIDVDLRDIAVLDEHLIVSTLRQSELLTVSREGELIERRRPATVSDQGNGLFEPHVAHRMLQLDDGSIVLQHQRANVSEQSRGYANVESCSDGVSHNALTLTDENGEQLRGVGLLPSGVVVDVALLPGGEEYAVLAVQNEGTAVFQGSIRRDSGAPCDVLTPSRISVPGLATSVAFDPSGRLLIQGRDTHALEIVGIASVPLGASLPKALGMELFYRPTTLGVACATCHPEGADDGVTWPLQFEGKRRTQVVARRISQTAPLHWRGQLGDMRALLQDTLVGRMGGELPDDPAMLALGEFMDRLPALVPPRPTDDPDAVEGKAIFDRLGCGQCHVGEFFTDNLNHDIGTGAEFQTPSLLGVAHRLPVMHDGCAVTLLDRFGECGGDARHGAWEELSSEELSQLVAFLETL